MTYMVYFRDSEECLRCISRRAREQGRGERFTRMGIAVVAIRLEHAS